MCPGAQRYSTMVPGVKSPVVKIVEFGGLAGMPHRLGSESGEH